MTIQKSGQKFFHFDATERNRKYVESQTERTRLESKGKVYFCDIIRDLLREGLELWADGLIHFQSEGYLEKSKKFHFDVDLGLYCDVVLFILDERGQINWNNRNDSTNFLINEAINERFFGDYRKGVSGESSKSEILPIEFAISAKNMSYLNWKMDLNGTSFEDEFNILLRKGICYWVESCSSRKVFLKSDAGKISCVKSVQYDFEKPIYKFLKENDSSSLFSNFLSDSKLISMYLTLAIDEEVEREIIKREGNRRKKPWIIEEPSNVVSMIEFKDKKARDASLSDEESTVEVIEDVLEITSPESLEARILESRDRSHSVEEQKVLELEKVLEKGLAMFTDHYSENGSKRLPFRFEIDLQGFEVDLSTLDVVKGRYLKAGWKDLQFSKSEDGLLCSFERYDGECEWCGSPKGYETIDPYLLEVKGLEQDVVLCERCYDDRIGLYDESVSGF